MNNVTLFGNLGAAPTMRSTKKGTPVANLSVATNERTTNQSGEWVDHTEWHTVAVFGKQAQVCEQYLAKGSKVLIEGKLRTRKWQDKDGNERYSTEVLADKVHFAGRPNSEGHPEGHEPYGPRTPPQTQHPTFHPKLRRSSADTLLEPTR